MVGDQKIGISTKGPGYFRAIHLRVTESEAAGLEAHARRLSQTRNKQVGLSEAVRDLLAQALSQQVEQPWETALKGLSFVAWTGGKPALPPLEEPAEGKGLSAIVLVDRGEL